MGIFSSIDDLIAKSMDQMKERFIIENEIVDTPDSFLLITKTYFNGKLMKEHELDLIPLVKGIQKRIT